jgi:CrcB protein
MSTPPTTHPSRPAPRVSDGRELLAIAAGGAIGASLRYAVALGIEAADQSTYWATTSANLIGAFLLGLLLSHIDSRAAHPLLRPFLVIGVFGSFTTFSALAFDNRLLASQDGELLGALHMASSIASGLVAFAAGAMLAWRHE